MKYKLIVSVIVCCFFLTGFIGEVHAAEHKLEDINIHVMLNEDGSARITETRKGTFSQDTENYIVINNLSKSKIKDFEVKENGETYHYVDDWDVEASREEKSFRNGLIETKKGYELAWGIGEYGSHEYQLEYTVTNFIKQLEGSQILFWRFVNDKTNIPPAHVTVEIETDKDFNEEEEKIWAFGFSGNIDFDDGKIIANSNQALDDKDYVTVLVKLEDNLFQTKDNINKSFEEVKKEALKGSDYGKEKVSFLKLSAWRNIIIISFIAYFIFKKFYRRPFKVTKKRPKKFKRKYLEQYYRDYPYEGNFLDVYYVLYMMGVSNFEKLLTAYILKWIKEERIVMKTEKVGFMFKKDKPALHFLNQNQDMDKQSNEGNLFHMMFRAAGSDEILQEKEFTKWTERNKKRLINWERRVINQSLKTTKQLGLVESQEKKVLFFKRKNIVLTKAGEEFEKKVHQYINYLHDFSLLNEHEPINVNIWDEIMIWAALLGRTKEVTKQFKKLYPNYDKDTIYTGNTVYLSHSMSSSTASSRAKIDGSGSGGSTSSSGGGGSFGGGSGGGTR